MRPLRSLRFWWWGNHLAKTGLAGLQHEQALEHHKVVNEVKQSRRRMLHDMADVVLRLESATDDLERAVLELRGERDLGR